MNGLTLCELPLETARKLDCMSRSRGGDPAVQPAKVCSSKARGDFFSLPLKGSGLCSCVFCLAGTPGITFGSDRGNRCSDLLPDNHAVKINEIHSENGYLARCVTWLAEVLP